MMPRFSSIYEGAIEAEGMGIFLPDILSISSFTKGSHCSDAVDSDHTEQHSTGGLDFVVMFTLG